MKNPMLSLHFSWWPAIRSYSENQYKEIRSLKWAWYWKLAISPFYICDWIIGLVVITLGFLTADMGLSMSSSGRALRSWFYGTVIGMLLFYPIAGEALNLSWFYATVTNYPATGPDPLACLKEYKYERYATAPDHEHKIKENLEVMGFMYSEKQIGGYIRKVAPKSSVTGQMVLEAARKHKVDARLMLAIMEIDSHFGTRGKAARTKNPGNVGNDDAGHLQYFDTWSDGVEAVAKWLDKNRKIIISPTAWEEAGLRTGLFSFYKIDLKKLSDQIRENK